MQQVIDFQQMNQDLQKNMMLSIVKIKLHEAEALMKKAAIQLKNAISDGTGQEIYDCAYESAMAEDRYGNLKLLYNTIIKGEIKNG